MTNPNVPSGGKDAGNAAGRIAERMEELFELVTHHARLYYEKDAPELSDADYDALVREAWRSADRALRAKNYTEAERILLEEGTIAPYAYATGFDYVHPYVKGYAAPTFTAMLYKTVSVER